MLYLRVSKHYFGDRILFAPIGNNKIYNVSILFDIYFLLSAKKDFYKESEDASKLEKS